MTILVVSVLPAPLSPVISTLWDCAVASICGRAGQGGVRAHSRRRGEWRLHCTSRHTGGRAGP